jgi:hypothetical protein
MMKMFVGQAEVEKKEPALGWRRADRDGIREEMKNQGLRCRMGAMTKEEAWRTFREKVGSLRTRFVQKRRRRSHNRVMWLTRDVLRPIGHK